MTAIMGMSSLFMASLTFPMMEAMLSEELLLR